MQVRDKEYEAICKDCCQNAFKLLPSCEKHERSRAGYIKLCYDRETLDRLSRVIGDLGDIANWMLHFEIQAVYTLHELMKKIPEKRIQASLKRKVSIIRQANNLPAIHNKMAVRLIDAREEISDIAHDCCVRQIRQITPFSQKKGND